MLKDNLTGKPAVVETGWRMPERKVLSGGLFGILAWMAILVANKYGAGVPMDFAPPLATLIGSIAAYVTPPTVRAAPCMRGLRHPRCATCSTA